MYKKYMYCKLTLLEQKKHELNPHPNNQYVYQPKATIVIFKLEPTDN